MAMKRPFGGQLGFTLVEILVALALTGIVAAAIYKVFGAQQKTAILQDQVVGMQQDLRGALTIMAREIRMAGYDPAGSANAGILSATAASLQITMDLNENGHDFTALSTTSATDPSEKIRYAPTHDADSDGIADTGQQAALGRESWAGGLQEVAQNIEAFNLVYLDQTNTVIPTPVVGDDLARIRAMQITLIAKTGKPDKDFTDSKTYRNQQNTVIFTPPAGDHYRRRLLSTTVEFRNLGLIK
jgi:type IV pilus assembly protein PilW